MSERLAALIGIMGEIKRAPLKPHEHHGTMASRGLRGSLNWVPIMSRGENLSDSRCDIFHSELEL